MRSRDRFLYQAQAAALRKGVGTLTPHTTAALGAGELGRSPSPARSVRRPVSARFCWVLASAAVGLVIATVVITAADGDLFLIPLVPVVLTAALIGVLVAVRRPGHPMGTLLCAYGLGVRRASSHSPTRAQPLSISRVRCRSACRCCG